ncbi:hypothetical protein BDV93DRAFT_525660 [Ceratobasidium sp. AG-I]|nr:hypothetical protein BDV93DRAFT_525660 [Ceratobasidium sp. AG-I]
MSATQPLESQDATHKVLNMPELVELICGFLGEKHCSGLMRTSRQFFRPTMVVIWRRVDIKQLLLLIPGTSFEEGCEDPSILDFEEGDSRENVSAI